MLDEASAPGAGRSVVATVFAAAGKAVSSASDGDISKEASDEGIVLKLTS